MANAYRPEIDGLRAVAVLPVLLYHAGVDGFRGGFVGVDVFFVISGYLVTRLILADGDTFSLPAFYERRVRRLFPALAVVLGVSSGAAWWWLLPADLAAYSRSLLAVLGLVANVHLWRTTGDYFARPAESMPLLHTWSLAVEEQFYLLYPASLVLTRRFGSARQGGLIAGAAVASLAIAVWASTHRPVAGFFLLPTRGWELALGALVAWHEPRLAGWVDAPARVRRRVMVGWAGVGLIGLALAALSAASGVPGAAALLPTVGTALVLVAARPGEGAGRLLAWPPVVGLGLISYSAYLWHQPLLAFLRATADAPPGPAARVGTCAVAVALAWVTWRLIERPWRDRARTPRRRLIVATGLAVAALAAVGVAGMVTRGGLERYSGLDRALVQGDVEGADYVVARFDARRDAPFDAADARRRLLIIGDSYAQDLVNALAEAGLDRTLQISTRYVAHYCGNLLLEPAAFVTRPADYDTVRCGPTLLSADAALRGRLREADVVWLASYWQGWQVPLLPASLEAMRAISTGPVRVFGPKHFGTGPLRALLGRTADERRAMTRPVSAETAPVVNALRAALPRDVFVDVQALLCGQDAGSCRVFTPDDALLSYDGAHLTRAGARYYGERLRTVPAVMSTLR